MTQEVEGNEQNNKKWYIDSIISITTFFYSFFQVWSLPNYKTRLALWKGNGGLVRR